MLQRHPSIQSVAVRYVEFGTHSDHPLVTGRGELDWMPFPFLIQGEQASATRSGGSSILRRMQVRPVAAVAANPSTSASLRDKRAKPAAKKHLSASVLQL